MKKLMIAALGLAFTAGTAVAGNIDSPGAPSAGSGMYTFQNLYDYLVSGTALSVAGSFQEPAASPASTMKSTKQIGDDVKALFDQCNATAADVAAGKKFFSTVGGSWGVQTGTGSGGAAAVVLKTGQTSSYQTYDDGYYQKGSAYSFTDNGDGTTTDNSTGLMWATSGTGAGCKNGSSVVWTAALDWAEGLTFAGYSDWRLPNYNEANALLPESPYQSATWVQLDPPNSNLFWTGTAFQQYDEEEEEWTTYAYAKSDSYADSGTVNATYARRVRAVRGGN